jgi:hypothetical protein
MNTQGGFCDLAISALKKMAIKKYKNAWATKRKADWLKAKWVNETCSYCSPQDLSLYQPHRSRVSPTSSAFNECARKDRKLLMLVEY